MIHRVLIAVCCAAALCANPVFAQDLTPEKKADIQKLMEVTGAQALGQQMSDQIMLQIANSIRARNPRVPQRTLDIVREEVSAIIKDNLPAFTEMVMPAYHKHFTHDDIKALLQFYSTDLGQRLIRTTPGLMMDSMRAGGEWAKSLQPELERRLKRRLQQEGIELAASP